MIGVVLALGCYRTIFAKILSGSRIISKQTIPWTQELRNLYTRDTQLNTTNAPELYYILHEKRKVITSIIITAHTLFFQVQSKICNTLSSSFHRGSQVLSYFIRVIKIWLVVQIAIYHTTMAPVKGKIFAVV